ncbi:MAG TPA: L,D-transpeptidase [Acidimicrobiales bacterium]|nr:L,D-transpeptidase [Acidimicrobiales bacterium]
MPRRVLAGVAAVLLPALLAACGSDGTRRQVAPPQTASTLATPTSPPTTTKPVNLVATAKVPAVPVFANPGDPEPVRTLENPTKPYDTELVFLVREQQPDWLNVLLPVRPNGSSGWIRPDDVNLTSHDYRMLIELGAHRLTVWRGEEVFAQEPIGVGTKDTPTPGGLYYTKELLQPIDREGRPIPDGPYGPYAYGLSGFSDVLYDFAGGDGVIGIHGTNDPSSIGRDASHGCIRMSNEAITRLATTLPIGVPVEIQA